MEDAKKVLQRLRGSEDVAGEMALLVEGLGIGGEKSIEEYIIGPSVDLNDYNDPLTDKDQITLYGPEEGQSWIARPAKGLSMLGSALGIISRHGSIENQESMASLVDPLVTLFGSVHENLPQTAGSMRNSMFPNFGSMFSVAGNQPKTDQWDEENGMRDEDDYVSDEAGNESDDNNLSSPLLSRQTTSIKGKDVAPPRRNSSLFQQAGGDAMGIGGGWIVRYRRYSIR